MYGGPGDDALHGGPGDDIMNGNAGDDHLFGGADSDAGWGGPGHDDLFGGYGIDYLDVLPRPARADRKDSFPADPPTWFEAARFDNFTGLDIMYGGWDRDWMQADVSAPGPPPGDRMVDSVGAFNAYYRCDAAYGDWGITRQLSPSLIDFLQRLAQGRGATDTASTGTSGFRETAIVFPQDAKANSNAPNADNPAHFVCSVAGAALTTTASTSTPMPTATATSTSTSTATATATPVPTDTPTPTATETATATPLPTDTPAPTATETATDTATPEPTPTETPTETAPPPPSDTPPGP
jgi:hypothetical protein